MNDNGPTGFTFFKSYWDSIRRLPDKNLAAVVRGMCGCAFEGKPIEEPPETAKSSDIVTFSILSAVIPNVEASLRNANNGRKGGKGASAKKDETEEAPLETNGETNGSPLPEDVEAGFEEEAVIDVSPLTGTVEEEEEAGFNEEDAIDLSPLPDDEDEPAKPASVTDTATAEARFGKMEAGTGSDKDKDKDKECNTGVKGADKLPTHTPKKTKRFVKPTVEEVAAYCRERGNNVDPQKFWDFYESKGWMVGKTHMTNWQASVRTWERKDGWKPSNGSNSNGPSSFGASRSDDAASTVGEIRFVIGPDGKRHTEVIE